MNPPLREKQFAIGNRKLSDSLPNALQFKSCIVWDSHWSSILITVTVNCLILTFSQVKATGNPTVANVCDVYCTKVNLKSSKFS